MNATQQPVDGDGHPTGGTDSPLSDQPLLDLLDVLVDDRGRVAAAEAMGVNYRTLVNCYNSRRVSRRMRQVLQEFRDAGGVGGDEPGDVDDDDVSGIEHESLERRVAVLEDENRGLRELVPRWKDGKGNWARLRLSRQGLTMTGSKIGGLPSGDTECPTPVQSPWRCSPTRNTPSARRRRWWPNGGSCRSVSKRRTAGLTGTGTRRGVGSWRLRCWARSI